MATADRTTDSMPLPSTRTYGATVTAKRALAPATMAIELAVDGPGGLHYREGQYIRIHLDDGRRRDLSIANPCRGDGSIELWLRDVGGDFSRKVFDELEPGARWTFDGPLGDAWVRDDGSPLLLVSGGTGLGPARGIVLAELERRPQRRIELIHGDADPAALAPAAELARLARTAASFEFVPVLQKGDGSWGEYRGTPDRVIEDRHPDLAGWSAHLFGPPAMVDAVVPSLHAAGIAADALHADAFTPGAADLDRVYPPKT